ncbi:cytochrome P450 [Ornithinibacillus massiliensis]|uniref:Cytochrome P450 n=1 Tax=Ornithinibacillus massiliensis TaxID=1944633 RepID=A0ABS5MI29_9BACI|nr:cytochrome P450 [Ornithinibacillus massiliensis]MBS3681393.1 cytochrome P450 [Ornithinibacillus massiliensis]
MPYREQIPIDTGIDNTVKLLLEGYNYITNRRNQFGRDIFETRLLGGQKAICVAGKEAVNMFYDEKKLIRQGAAPKRLRQTLFGEHAIQTMDGESHRHRKELFMSLMTSERLDDIKTIMRKHLERASEKWVKQQEVVLFSEMCQLLTKVACEWAGVPLKENEWSKRANELEAMFDSAGALGGRHWKGRNARNFAESWLKGLVQDVRNNAIEVPQNTALYKMAWYQDKDGVLLHEQIVAVELLNILRPIAAIAVYITFGALALYEHPAEKEKLQTKPSVYFELFVQEVRRYYPFFPVLVARVRDDYLWNGHDFRKGNLVLLDIYGTNHHPDIWEHPDMFDPERFKDRDDNLYDFIPQGGGDYYRGHRCPGEWLTIELMKETMDFLINHVEYEVPKQDLRFSMRRFPSLPKSRFIIHHIRQKNG